eukprot:8752-Eustigmatos_ZCMA.PRE.1
MIIDYYAGYVPQWDPAGRPSPDLTSTIIKAASIDFSGASSCSSRHLGSFCGRSDQGGKPWTAAWADV